jgi:magnesium-transporting ATPase (P-type)
MDTPDPIAWHSLEAREAMRRLASDDDGLDSAEAASRLASMGPNTLPAARSRPWWRRLAAQFDSILIKLLLAAAVLAFALGHPVDGAVILLVVVVNAGVAYLQEGRAQRALDAVQDLLAPACTVVRDGRRMTIAAELLVRGDIILLEAGDRVPADARVLRASNLQVDESALTGESLPVDKTAAAVAAGAGVGDRPGIVHAGTLVSGGQGRAVVVATGAATELGRIGALLASVSALDTPLLRQINAFAKRLAAGIGVLCAGVAMLAVALYGQAPDEVLMAVIGIAVAAIPEGLPMIVTITLAIGAQRMAARNAIVRTLPAVETLGSVGVICSDKTGTLTRSEMVVRQLVTVAGAREVTGTGYAPHGALAPPAGDDAGAAELARCAWLCNDASLHEGSDGWFVEGDTMEGALRAMALKAGIDPRDMEARHPRIAEIPFDAGHRYMATLHDAGEGGAALVCIKGAPERLLALCAGQRMPDGGDIPVDHGYWVDAIERLANQGARVLAFAERRLPAVPQVFDLSCAEAGPVLLGLVGLSDPPRPEAVEAITECRSAGIRVKMVTGDHAATAGAIARQLGLEPGSGPVTGSDIDAADAQSLRALLQGTDVFARTTPEHKLRLVQALQEDGLIVAMTGDGVNDAPALRRADIGVAMGIKGTDAARQASQLVLADDNFSSIVSAVRQGRIIHDNITKSIAWSLPTNGGEALVIVAALLFGLTLPITTVQILWINMVTAVTLGLTFAFEPAEPGLMQRPPRPPRRALLSPFLLWRIGLVSLLFAACAFGLFAWAESRGMAQEQARTLVVNAIVALEVFYLFSIRFLTRSSLNWRGVLGTPPVLVALALVVLLQSAFTFLPSMQAVFGTRSLTATQLALAFGCGVVLLSLLEIEKWMRRGMAGPRHGTPDPARAPGRRG